MRARVLVVAAALAGAAALFSPSASAWGPEGHRLVAALAETRLTSDARRAVGALVGEGGLVGIAAWADDIQKERRETAPWHYVNIPGDRHDYDPARDCAAPRQGDCVVAAIERFQAVLADPTRTRDERAEALKFLTHFVADVHQPLHCLKDEEGGNRILVRFFGEAQHPISLQPWNLHTVWDSGLLERAGLGERELFETLRAWLDGRPPSDLRASPPAAWALESHGVALLIILDLPPDRHLDDRYLRQSLPIVEARLALAGARLAALLNEALAPPVPDELLITDGGELIGFNAHYS